MAILDYESKNLEEKTRPLYLTCSFIVGFLFAIQGILLYYFGPEWIMRFFGGMEAVGGCLIMVLLVIDQRMRL